MLYLQWVIGIPVPDFTPLLVKGAFTGTGSCLVPSSLRHEAYARTGDCSRYVIGFLEYLRNRDER